MAQVGINGLGRIGRATLKIVMDTPGLDLAAANDLGTSDNVADLFKYNTLYGRYEKTVEATDDGDLMVGGHWLALCANSSLRATQRVKPSWTPHAKTPRAADA